jgi:exosome complex component MTR3
MTASLSLSLPVLIVLLLQDKEEKELSMLMVQALEVSLRLETFPKSEIDVFVLVLEESGGMVGAAITAASLALADAGIEMYDLVASCSVVRLPLLAHFTQI